MSFFFFVILNAIIFIRPAEIFEPLYGIPLYNICVIICFVLTLPNILAQFTVEKIVSRPISTCVFSLLPAAILSHVAHGDASGVAQALDEYSRLILYWTLLLGTVTTVGRLRSLIFWVTISIGVMTLLCLLQYYEVVDIPILTPILDNDVDKQTGEMITILRLQASGLFNNPNAFSRILTIAMLLSFYWMTDPKLRMASPFWAGMVGMFGYAQFLTKSRGGFLGLLLGVAILFVSRFGVKRSIPLLAIGLPVMLALFGGRSTEISVDGGTGQQRVQIWDAGIEALKTTPVFGIGMNNYPEVAGGYVAHNSLVHCYVELGFLGGTLFTGCFFLSISTLWKLGKASDDIVVPELRRMRSFLLAILSAEAAGMMSISRCYVIPTYLLLGLAAVYFTLLSDDSKVTLPRLSVRLAGRLFVVSLVLITVLILYIKVQIRRTGS